MGLNEIVRVRMTTYSAPEYEIPIVVISTKTTSPMKVLRMAWTGASRGSRRYAET